MSKKSHVGTDPWNRNRANFPHVTPQMWAWAEECLLLPRKKGPPGFRAIVGAGGRHAKKYLQLFAENKNGESPEERQLSMGLPCPIEVACGVIEDPRSEAGCEYWSAHNRFYYDCADKRPSRREPGCLSGPWIDSYVTSAERWVQSSANGDERIFVVYGDPNDNRNQEVRDRVDSGIRAAFKLSGEEKLFNMWLGLPWGRFVGTWAREHCGEQCIMEGGRPKLFNGKRELVRVGDDQYAFGFCIGQHPIYHCGGSVTLEALAGAGPMMKIIEAHFGLQRAGYKELKNVKGRMQLFGMGPGKMDDGRLRIYEGPVGKLAAWPFAGRTLSQVKQSKLRELLREMVEQSKELYQPTLRGWKNWGVYGLAGAIADRIWVLYHAAHSLNPHARVET